MVDFLNPVNTDSKRFLSDPFYPTCTAINRSGDERESGGERGIQVHDGGHGHHLLPLRAAALLAEGTRVLEDQLIII